MKVLLPVAGAAVSALVLSLALAGPAGAASGAFVIPAGDTATLSGGQWGNPPGNCPTDPLVYGYTLDGTATQVDSGGSGTCIAAKGATIGPVNTDRTLKIYLTDNYASYPSCSGATYYSDGSGNANHARVTAHGAGWQVSIADCDVGSATNIDRVPADGDGNLNVTVTITGPPPPTASITSPLTGGTYTLHQSVSTSFSCTEGAGGPGVSSCTDSNGGSAPSGSLDTSTAGSHTYTVTATSGDGQTGSASISYTVAGPPTASISSPADGQTFNLHQSVATSFSCSPGTDGASVSSCVDSNGANSPSGSLDTSTAGSHTYTVTATSGDGQTGTASISYTVAAPPTASITSPADGQTYNLHQVVSTSFSCSEGSGGPGLSSCTDSNGANSPSGTLDTSTAGPHTYTVTATSSDGQTGSAHISYTVATGPSAKISSPANNQTYNLNASVPTSFSCQEASGGPGLSSCTDSNGASGGTGSLVTSKAGSFSYTVTATSSDGQTGTTSISYTVAAPPSAKISSPANNQTYNLNASVPTSFSCQEGSGGPGLSSCTDSNGANSPSGTLDTSTTGPHTYTVTATSSDGQTGTASISYTVAAGLQASTPPPVFQQSADLSPVTGNVLIKLPGSNTFTPVTGPLDVPDGATIDATQGTVSLTVQLPNGGGFETGKFYSGEFVVNQAHSGTLLATLAGGNFGVCTLKGARGAHAAKSGSKKSKTVVRKLWGNAHGNYTTKGRYGSASVSGTIWLTEDTCAGTYFYALKDNIIVVSFKHPHHKHNIKQGHHFFIPAGG
ncbi:MAG TPA: hypothetical protein VID68_11830 [Solirubrobacteraceae bacterium]